MSTYSTNLALELIGTGEQAGVWGTTTNTNLGTLIEQSISGYVTQAVATGTDTTITIPNGSSGVARNMYIELTGTGGASTNLVVPANKKLYFIFNNSTGAVTVKVSGQTGVSVPTGKKMVLVSNGTDIVNGLNYIADFASNSATITHLSATSASITNLTLTSLVISNLSIASANITTLTGSTQTLSGNLTLNGGTANGVLYLNGSKVATSGTALVFDGTAVGIGQASGTSSGFSTAPNLLVYGATNANILVAGDSSGVGITSARYANTTGGGILRVGKYRGTYASPSAAQTGDTAGDVRFEVWGGSNLRRVATIAGTVETFTSDTDISGYLAFNTTSSGSTTPTEKMRLDSSGNLGIGTSSPGQKLHVVGNIRTTNSLLESTGTSVNFGTITGGFLAFLSGSGAEAGRFDSSGNLGIGTSSPGGRLDVVGSATTSGINVSVSNTSTSGQYPSTGYLLKTYDGAAVTTVGALGGTSSTFGYQQLSANQVNLTATRAGGLRISTANSGPIIFAPTTGADPDFATEVMRITPAGNIVAGASAALATTATNGFLYVPTCAGTPTGTPTAITGMAPIVVDTTNNKLYFYSTGVWRDAGP